jgi:hypothetical protein
MVFFERGKNAPPKSPAMADGASVVFVMIQRTESLSQGGQSLANERHRSLGCQTQ